MKKLSQKKHRTAARFVCLLFIASLLPGSENATKADRFKPFKLKTLEGTAKKLQDFSNKATLIAFYYPRCAYCNLAIPEIQKIYDKFKNQGLSAVIINVIPEQSKLLPDWQAKYHVTIPVLIGASQDSLMDDYHLTITPTHCLLGENGEVLLRQDGYNRGDEKILDMKIAEALNVGMP